MTILTFVGLFLLAIVAVDVVVWRFVARRSDQMDGMRIVGANVAVIAINVVIECVLVAAYVVIRVLR